MGLDGIRVFGGIEHLTVLITKHIFPSSAMKRVGLSNYFPQKYNFTLISRYCANDTFGSRFELLSREQELKPNQILGLLQRNYLST